MVVQIESLPVLKATRWAKDDDVETNFLIHEIEGKHREDYFLCQDLRGRSQTTFTRRGRKMVQKCPLFVNIYTIEYVNEGG